jgi:hypothetical protein
MVLVTRECKELTDCQLERNIMRQDESRRKREFDRLACDSNPYPPRRNKSDMRAVISARTSEMGHEVRTNGRRAAANVEHRGDARGVDTVAQNIGRLTLAPAGSAVAPVPPRADTQSGEAGLQVHVTPSQVLGAAAGSSSSSHNVPPITTINPSHLSYRNESRPTDVGTMSHTDFIDYLDPQGTQTSNAHQEDAPMGN